MTQCELWTDNQDMDDDKSQIRRYSLDNTEYDYVNLKVAENEHEYSAN